MVASNTVRRRRKAEIGPRVAHEHYRFEDQEEGEQTMADGNRGQRETPSSQGGVATAEKDVAYLGSVSSAIAAAETDIGSQQKAIVDAWQNLLIEQSREYQKQLAEVTSKIHPTANGTEAAEPFMRFLGIPYPWWEMLLAGPFQAVAPLGPFEPRKVIVAGEPAFMVAALWRNPAPLPFGPNPSAAQIMSAFNFRIRLDINNLTTLTVVPGGPVVNGVFGAPNVNVFSVNLPAFPTPPQGRPDLYEVNMVVDILGPGVGLPPFAGFSTWVFDPDTEPPFFFPIIPGVGPVFIPGVGPGLQHDIPARFLVYS
jgi:hypothetical protein